MRIKKLISTPILRPLKMDGRLAGMEIRQKIARGPQFMDLAVLIIWGSIFMKALWALKNMGHRETQAKTAIFGVSPRPNIIIKTGKRQ
jgi:hypothetical protein